MSKSATNAKAKELLNLLDVELMRAHIIALDDADLLKLRGLLWNWYELTDMERQRRQAIRGR